MSLVSIIPSLVAIGSQVLDRVIPDPEQKAQAQLELLKMQQDGAFKELDAQLQLNLAQAKVNEIEAGQDSLFKSGWRPAAGWACVAGLGYEFLLRPMLPWALAVAGVHDVPALPSLDNVLFELLFGMLGLGTLRTAERFRSVNAIQKTAQTAAISSK